MLIKVTRSGKMSRKSHFGKRCKDPSQYDLDLTYFQFLQKFLILYDYLRVLKLCGIEMDVHVEFLKLNIPVSHLYCN